MNFIYSLHIYTISPPFFGLTIGSKSIYNIASKAAQSNSLCVSMPQIQWFTLIALAICFAIFFFCSASFGEGFDWFVFLAVHYGVMVNLGSWRGWRKLDLLLTISLCQSYASWVPSKLSACTVTRKCTPKQKTNINLWHLIIISRNSTAFY